LTFVQVLGSDIGACLNNNHHENKIPSTLVATALFGAFIESVAFADSFGSFTIDFVDIGNPGNAADSTSYGAVPYAYRMGGDGGVAGLAGEGRNTWG
jgi:hypothetical protein